MKALFLSLPLLLCSCNPAVAQESAIASLTVQDTNICAGVAIQPQVVLTAEHCLSPDMLVQGKSYTVLAKDGNDHVLLKTEHVYRHYLRVNAKAKAGKTMQVGQRVQTYGHPGGLEVQYRVGHVSGYQVAPPSVQEIVDTKQVVMLDVNITRGDSGGPILNDKGEVIGTVSMAYEIGGFVLGGAFDYAFTPEQWGSK